MKTVKNTRSQKTNTRSKATTVKVIGMRNGKVYCEERSAEKFKPQMPMLHLTLSEAQSERITTLAKMTNMKPEEFAIMNLFAGFDACDMLTWKEYVSPFGHEYHDFVEEGKCSGRRNRHRIEDKAPARLKKAAGYVSPAATSAKEVARV